MFFPSSDVESTDDEFDERPPPPTLTSMMPRTQARPLDQPAPKLWVPAPPAKPPAPAQRSLANAHRSPAPQRPAPVRLSVSFAEPKLSASTSTSSALGSGPHSGSSGPPSGRAMLPQANFGARTQQQHPQQQQQHQQHQQQQQQHQQQQSVAFRGAAQSSAAGIERLCQAASRGDIPLLNELLRAGTPLEADKEGRNAIHYASQNGHTTATRMLLDAGTEVDVEDNLGYTALHRAAAQGHRETVQLLISRGANINKQDNVANFTALHLAAQNGHNQSARVLLYAGCDSNAKNNYGDTALHTAARYGHAGVTRILISARARINETNKNGDTGLHIAAALKRRKITKLMMEAGVDTEVRNKQQETALDVARRKAHAEIVHIILNTTSAVAPGPNYHPGHHVGHPPATWAHAGPGSIALTNPTPGYQPLLMNAGQAPVYESMLTLGGSRMHLPAGPLPLAPNGDVNGEAEDRADATRAQTGTGSTAPPAISKKKSSIFGSLFFRKKKDKIEAAEKKAEQQQQQQQQQQHPTSNGVASVGVSAGQPPGMHPALHPAFITTATGTQYYRDLAGNVRQGPVSYLPHTAISCGCLHQPVGHPSHLPHAAVRPMPAQCHPNPNDPSGSSIPTWTAAPYHVPCVDHGYAEYHGRFQPPLLEADLQAGPRLVRSRSDESLSMSEHKAKCQEEKARQMAMRELKAMRAAAGTDGGGSKAATGPVQGRRAVSPSSYVPRISVSDAKLRPETTGQSAQPSGQANRHSDILTKMESIQRDYTRPSPDGSNDHHISNQRSPHSTQTSEETPSPGNHQPQPQPHHQHSHHQQHQQHQQHSHSQQHQHQQQHHQQHPQQQHSQQQQHPQQHSQQQQHPQQHSQQHPQQQQHPHHQQQRQQSQHAHMSAAERHRAMTAQLQAWYAKQGRPMALQPRGKPSPPTGGAPGVSASGLRMSTDV